MKKKRYKSGYDITVECDFCHFILYGHTELQAFGKWNGGTIRFTEGICPVCYEQGLVVTISNEYYIPKNDEVDIIKET
jgi:hypothetical protein